jgi:hypothetical protein
LGGYARTPAPAGATHGQEVSHEIQTFFYGHIIHQTYAKPGIQLVNEQRFDYPIYEVFITAPFVYADFADVQRWPLRFGFVDRSECFALL